jgi:signal transduction histidine kinase
LTRDANRDPLTELARVLGHELGEIAALFDGYVDDVEDRASPDAVAALRHTTERLRNVYEGLHELAHVASSEPSRSAVDPASALAAAREHLRERARDLDVDLRPLPAVVGDPAQLEELFTRLLRSATSRASSARRVIVTGSREGPHVRLDIGAEPPHDRLPSVRRGDSLVGQGVDMAVSSRIVEHNGGRLWVTGNARSGTTISLTLPAADP